MTSPKWCSRCYKPIRNDERVVSDPHCGAPDCDGLNDESHYDCLPVALQRIEDEDSNF